MSGENFYLINSNTFVAINPNFPLLKDHVFNILPKEDIPSSPEKESSIITRETMVTITAYSSTSFECDKSPFITASGTYVREGIVATNFLPFGTKIKIPEIFGEKIFVVEDRMAKRYLYVVDVWFPSYHEALNFGKKYTRIEILN
jgi:3D (Asp-Asp-Asp) domain-containing protein